MPETSILLADDNFFMLDHVRRTLEREHQFKVIAAVSDPNAVLLECARLKPDVIVLDISMGDQSGIDLALRLRDSGSHSKVVFLTVHEDRDFLNAAIGAGGSAYVVKSRLSADLIRAINAALDGKLFVSLSLLENGS